MKVEELRKDNLVLFSYNKEKTFGSFSGVVNKILGELVLIHFCNSVECIDMMVLIDKKYLYPFPIGDNMNTRDIKGLKEIGNDMWEYKGKKIRYRHELQNVLWDDGVSFWPKGTSDEEKEVIL